ncbi:Uncharacterised protein [Bordetella pertussis]|nr:Uncharacterised protein [Bordetella pertussis]
MFGVDAREGLLHGLLVGYVERLRAGAQALLAQVRHGGLDGVRVAAVDQYMRAAAGQCLRDAQPQAARRAGDQGHLAGQGEALQIR